MDSDTTHECPKIGCGERISITKLACQPHWFDVSRELRREVYRTWQHGLGAGTPSHRRAVAAAIADMNSGAAQVDPAGTST